MYDKRYSEKQIDMIKFRASMSSIFWTILLLFVLLKLAFSCGLEVKATNTNAPARVEYNTTSLKN